MTSRTWSQWAEWSWPLWPRGEQMSCASSCTTRSRTFWMSSSRTSSWAEPEHSSHSHRRARSPSLAAYLTHYRPGAFDWTWCPFSWGKKFSPVTPRCRRSRWFDKRKDYSPDLFWRSRTWRQSDFEAASSVSEYSRLECRVAQWSQMEWESQIWWGVGWQGDCENLD